MHITVLHNRPGTSTTENIVEADNDTKKSAEGIADTLVKMGHQAETLEIGFSEIANLSALQTDFVFNLVEWSGREYKYGVHVIEQLEKAGLKFTGSHAWGYKLSSDKIMMKQEMDSNHIPTPKWSTSRVLTFPYPAIVKPVFEHCGIGISQKSVVTNDQELDSLITDLENTYKEPVLVEEFIDGPEVQVTILEKDGLPWVLPPALIQYQKKTGYWGILSYEAKWVNGWEARMSDWAESSQLSPAVAEKINKIAIDCYKFLGGRSYSRVDMRIFGDQVYALEINNNPGIDFDPDSGIAVSAKLAGLTWEGLLANIISQAQIVP